MAALRTGSPPGCEGFGDSVAETPVVELAKADVEVIETSVEENAMVEEEVADVGNCVVELVTAVVVVDALEPDADEFRSRKYGANSTHICWVSCLDRLDSLSQGCMPQPDSILRIPYCSCRRHLRWGN